jgi:hypothetical protein
VLYLLEDARTGAQFFLCNIPADKLVSLGTTDVPLDPEVQPDVRANRDLEVDHVAFQQMISDAQAGRSFADIVCEFTRDFSPDKPLKVIGGQHRFEAVKLALEKKVNKLHGLRVYVGLDSDQRMDVQVTSNKNIAVSPDWLDRLYETKSGPQLRKWCIEAGLLEKDGDFLSRRQRGKAITVRDARTFVMNYFEGRRVPADKFADVETTPSMAETGGVDPRWEKLKKDAPGIWKDAALIKAAREFAALAQAQRDFYERNKSKLKDASRRRASEWAEKAFNFAILSGWAYVAGVLETNPTRLQRHFDLRISSRADPLSAKVLASAKDATVDGPTYRGLGTRNDAKERGRCVEMFFLQAEKGGGLTSNLVNAALARHLEKVAKIARKTAEERLSRDA